MVVRGPGLGELFRHSELERVQLRKDTYTMAMRTVSAVLIAAVGP